MNFSRTLIAAAALAMAGAVSAAPTNISFISADPVPQVVSTVSFDSGVSTSNVSVLEYIVSSTTPAGTFATFCLEPFHHLAFPWTYDNAGTFTTAQADALSMLFTGANWRSWDSSNDGVTQDFQRAGLGLAVWDIMQDGGAFNLASGTFSVVDDGFGGAGVAFANAAYAAGNTSMTANLIRLSDPIKQDLVMAVPEPGTYALMIAGLLSVGFVARRRKRS